MEKISAYLIGELIQSNEAEAHTLQQKSYFGEKVRGKIQYSYSEALYLMEKNKIQVLDSKNKENDFDKLLNKLKKLDKKIQTKYPVFKDLRDKGFIVKTALKFGADFRVYDKGFGPGEEHARWIVFTDNETKSFNWQDFAAKNRVAHSTKKKLLIAIVDEESSVSYYEVDWIKL